MKQKNCLFFCFLMSTMLLFSFSSLFAAVAVTYLPGSFPYNTTGNVITARVVVSAESIAAFDLITKFQSTVTNAYGSITAVNVSAVTGAVYDPSQVNGVTDDFTRIYGFSCATPVMMAPGTYDFTFTVTTSCDTGQFCLSDGGQWLVDLDPVYAYSQFVNTSAANAALTHTTGCYRVYNQPPVITNCPSQALVFNACDIVTYNFDFTDPSLQCLPAADETWNVLAGSPGSIDNNGNFVWDPPAVAGVCGLYEIKVTVTDEYGGKDTCQFEVSLISDAPEFTQCPTPGSELFVYWGWTADGDVTAIDPDNCPVALQYTLNNFTGPISAGPFQVNLATGEWSWPTTFGDDAYLGDWTATIDVTDGCGTTSCSFTIHVAPNFQVKIEKSHDTYSGGYEEISISLKHWTEGFGGYDLLIAYDNSALSLISASPGNILTTCGFEYFTYRFGANGNCAGSCPSGLVRLVAIADINNGANHPACYGEGYPANPLDPIRDLAVLKFLVTSDYTYECMFVPVSFFWIDCGDNAFSSITGDTLHIARKVTGYDGVGDITGQPFYGGWQGIEPDPLVCLIGDKYYPDTIVDFCNGGVDIICIDSIDDRGDLNLNGIDNEIADAVLYTNYFLYGLSVFDPLYLQAQRAASDVNADGTPLTVGDLVYLLRIIVGDALPFPKLTPFATSVDFNIVNGKVSTESSENIGALYMTFDVNGDYSLISHTDMTVLSNVRDSKLHVLIYSGMENMRNSIPAGVNELLTVTGAELSSVDVSDYLGNSMLVENVRKTALPTEFSLSQNVPNPFNPLTKIGFDLPVAADWKLDIYNVNGQLVQSYNGTNIGHVEVTWDANNASSGVYFYKVAAGAFTDTKKMVLMK